MPKFVLERDIPVTGDRIYCVSQIVTLIDPTTAE